MKRGNLLRIGLILAVLGAIGFVFYNIFVLKPEVVNIQQLEKLPRVKEITLVISPRAHVEEVVVKALQGPKEVILFKGKLPETTNEVKFEVRPKEFGLRDGSAQVVVELRRFFLIKHTYEVYSKVDTKAPRIRVIYAPYTVLQGGSGGVRVRVNEPVDLFVEIADRKFKAYEVAENTYISLFAVPPDVSPKEVIKVVAIDRVGNKSVLPLGTGIKRNRFKTVRIELKRRERLVRAKLENILGEVEEGMSFVELFKKVNEDLRRENTKKIWEIGQDSAKEKYWHGRFIQMRRSKVISRYGERRKYYYGGKLISTSWHLGYDLASVRNAKVPAANSGVVVFAGDLGIYGNTVIIDHGYGLMSLYAHLGEFKVKEGQFVKKGQIIGRTDATGLAFGDHLHFGIIVGGYEVTPLEWWDPKWIRTRIEPLFTD